MALHNAICPRLHVQIEKNADEFVYRYDLENGKQSKDSITTFSLVIYPDPATQIRAQPWSGGQSTAIVGEQIALPSAPPGGLVLLLCPEGQPLRSGEITKFEIHTQARPGFTTAATEHFPHLDLTDEWPQQILDELDPVLAPAWIDRHLITLGPRYAPDEPAPRIAADYISAIQELVRRGGLEQTSPFVNDALAGLDAVAKGGSTGSLVISAGPRTDTEAGIFNALALALNATNTTVRKDHSVKK